MGLLQLAVGDEPQFCNAFKTKGGLAASLTYELVCSKCGHTIYSGFDLRSPNDILKPMSYSCKKCGAKLTPSNFKVDVTKLEGRFA
jgi:predicted SprT family Zn-dependent metalloprotease